MEKFFTVLAWIFGCYCTLIFILAMIYNIMYVNSIEQKIDNIQGKDKGIHCGWQLLIAIICWVWIFTR